jgi:hydroxyethylthiazole kinase-like uncharacterized protein yjeF
MSKLSLSACAAPLVNAAEMRALEQAAVAAGTTEEALMEQAGAGLAECVRDWPAALCASGAVIVCGKGHNAGDACVLARHLLERGWKVELRAAYPPETWRPLARAKFLEIAEKVRMVPLESEALPAARGLLMVDGLLGTGAGGALKEPVLTATRMLNRFRGQHRGELLAIDLPSGMDADTGAADPDTVRADATVTLGFPKAGLCAPGAEDFTGRIVHVPLALPLPDNAAARAQCVTPQLLRPLLPRRPFSMHKGQAGRVGILAGSRGLTGAARLAAAGAVAAGAGLVTLFCPQEIYEVLAASCPPEIMVRAVHSCTELMTWNLDAIGVGPGLGSTPPACLVSLLRDDARPLVVDADALNAMAAHGVSLCGRTGGPRLLTPHPGELARLTERFCPGGNAASFAAQMNAVVLSKSARSVVVSAEHPPLYNTTGHPMLAKGGFGDVLTGFCTAFAAQGMDLRAAAALGSWLLGDATRWAGGGEETGYTPSRLLQQVGASFDFLRKGSFA